MAETSQRSERDEQGPRTRWHTQRRIYFVLEVASAKNGTSAAWSRRLGNLPYERVAGRSELTYASRFGLVRADRPERLMTVRGVRHCLRERLWTNRPRRLTARGREQMSVYDASEQTGKPLTTHQWWRRDATSLGIQASGISLSLTELNTVCSGSSGCRVVPLD